MYDRVDSGWPFYCIDVRFTVSRIEMAKAKETQRSNETVAASNGSLSSNGRKKQRRFQW